MDFETTMKQRVDTIEAVIREYMPKNPTFQKTVVEAMDYTMSAGGKRIRPLLMGSTFELFGGKGRVIVPFMAALEMIHTYSLIHDDLPALDNDDYRRGRKTAHIVYGEAMAILAGDSLLNYAYETAAKAFSIIDEEAGFSGSREDGCEFTEEQYFAVRKELEYRRNVERAMQILASKPGIYGMIGGQVADVELTGTRLNAEQLVYIYENKNRCID